MLYLMASGSHVIAGGLVFGLGATFGNISSESLDLSDDLLALLCVLGGVVLPWLFGSKHIGAIQGSCMTGEECWSLSC